MTLNIDPDTFDECLQKRRGGAMIHEAFPMLTATEREFLLTGMSVEEQEEMYGE